MLHDLSWLDPGQRFPPSSELPRLERYTNNLSLFQSDIPAAYAEYGRRIQRVIGNFEDVISFPVIFNYQKLMTLKMADLVCGEYPTITGPDNAGTTQLAAMQLDTDFNAKMYESVIDVSRYGDGVWRVYRDESGKNTFTAWDPRQWFPIVSQDGTNTITHNVLCWQENRGTELQPEWYLIAQIHSAGKYEQRTYHMDRLGGQILSPVDSKVYQTGLKYNAVIHLRPYMTTDTVYGYDDYTQIDSIISELMTRVAQVSNILDRNADPALTGPITMLKPNPRTGEMEFHKGRFYATSPGDNEPRYLTWDGQLDAAFQQIEFLVNQLYILSEMGSALVGGGNGESSGLAVSGAAMRFKMIAPLAKARRLTNAMSNKVKQLFSMISSSGYDIEMQPGQISVSWSDGIPNDPRETIELIKLETGENQIMPLEIAITEELGRTPEEADKWISMIDERAEMKALRDAAAKSTNLDPDNPEGADGKGGSTGANKGMSLKKKGSNKGLNSQKIDN